MFSFEINLFGLLSLIGLIHTVYALVYMTLRAGDFKRALYPILFFFVLSGAFLTSFVQPYVPDLDFIKPLNHGFWSVLPIAAVILIVQIAHIERMPQFLYQFLLLFIIPIFASSFYQSTDAHLLIALILGGLSALTLWINRDTIGTLSDHKVSGRERYWLVMAVIFLTSMLLVLDYAYLSRHVDVNEFTLIQIVLGLGLVYLVSTTMFRIYPQALQLVDRHLIKLARILDGAEPEGDPVLISKLRDLIDVQKLYQEPNFSRTELARELNVAEGTVSKLVADVYGKTLPQLTNEKRVTEACDLLLQTNLNVSDIATQVGFGSIASFNRVFKEIKNESPSEFRSKKNV